MSQPTVEELLARAHARAQQMGLPYFGAMHPGEAYALWVAGMGAVLIDVRTRAEWDWVGRVPGSDLIEWNTYPGGQRNPIFMAELAHVAPFKDKPAMFLCRSGARSDAAARLATEDGYRMCINILEGFEGDRDPAGHRGNLGGWRRAGLPWVQS